MTTQIELDRRLADAFVDQIHTVVERWTMAATHAGDFMGVPPTGRRITLTGIDISRMQDGRIAEHWTECDLLGLLGQLGADLGGGAR